MTPLITLLSDFGLVDGYVGAMKGVLLRRCPEARLIDLSHEIAPGAIDMGAYVLHQAGPWFPEAAIHLAVVDPGVGSGRRAVVLDSGTHRYVAPDNGLLTLVLETAPDGRAFLIENEALWEPEVSPVFHGRDIFSPVAAHLASGGGFEAVGPQVALDSLVRRPWPLYSHTDTVRTGQVIHVDRFGNLVTNLRIHGAENAIGTVEVSGYRIPVARTYSDVPEGELVALRGSTGLLEIACHYGSALEKLGSDDRLVVTWRLRGGG